MAEEIKVTETTEVKERSRTDLFKEHVQKMIYQTLGVKVSKDKAWAMFKNMIHGTTEFVLNIEGDEKKLPLAGVGTFCILETKPRGSKAGLDKDGNPIEGAEVWNCVPRFRFYPSSVTAKMVEQVYGCADHGIALSHYGIFKTEDETVENTEAADNAEEVEAVEETATADEFNEFDEEI
jgi:hypothetical protein